MTYSPIPSRRDFLKLLTNGLLVISGLLGGGLLLRYLGWQEQQQYFDRYDLGPLDNFPPGSRTLAPQVPAVILRTADDFTALSLVCPHLGCTVEQKEDGFACPCHGSQFDTTGNLRNGPAKQPLKRLRLETSPAGRLILYTD